MFNIDARLNTPFCGELLNPVSPTDFSDIVNTPYQSQRSLSYLFLVL